MTYIGFRRPQGGHCRFRNSTCASRRIRVIEGPHEVVQFCCPQAWIGRSLCSPSQMKSARSLLRKPGIECRHRERETENDQNNVGLDPARVDYRTGTRAGKAEGNSLQKPELQLLPG